MLEVWGVAAAAAEAMCPGGVEGDRGGGDGIGDTHDETFGIRGELGKSMPCIQVLLKEEESVAEVGNSEDLGRAIGCVDGGAA